LARSEAVETVAPDRWVFHLVHFRGDVHPESNQKPRVRSRGSGRLAGPGVADCTVEAGEEEGPAAGANKRPCLTAWPYRCVRSRKKPAMPDGMALHTTDPGRRTPDSKEIMHDQEVHIPKRTVLRVIRTEEDVGARRNLKFLPCIPKQRRPSKSTSVIQVQDAVERGRNQR